jgi:hypothetical protein
MEQTVRRAGYEGLAIDRFTAPNLVEAVNEANRTGNWKPVEDILEKKWGGQFSDKRQDIIQHLKDLTDDAKPLEVPPLLGRKQPLPNPGRYIEETYGGIDALGNKKPGSNMPHGAYGKYTGGSARPHGHHIVPQVGRSGSAQEARDILTNVGLDPIRGQENLVWAPDWNYLNSAEYADQVLIRLQKAKQTKEGITEELKAIGEIVARGKKLEKLPKLP